MRPRRSPAAQTTSCLRLGRGQGDAGAWQLAQQRAARRLIERAIEQGVEFLFSVDPASAAYPIRLERQAQQNWWKFGFPVFYVTDLLQIVEALVALGYGRRSAPGGALTLVREKQDEQGRWALEYDYAGKTWVDFGPKKQPNKWVTLRAWRVEGRRVAFLFLYRPVVTGHTSRGVNGTLTSADDADTVF